jgi:hypothetical protein
VGEIPPRFGVANRFTRLRGSERVLRVSGGLGSRRIIRNMKITESQLRRIIREEVENTKNRELTPRVKEVFSDLTEIILTSIQDYHEVKDAKLNSTGDRIEITFFSQDKGTEHPIMYLDITQFSNKEDSF